MIISENKIAFITGCNSQDGSYLAELLLEKGYEVHAMVRRHSVPQNQTFRLNHLMKQLHMHYGDVTDAANVFALIAQIKPDEIYNLAAQSHVKISFELPLYTMNTNATGFLNVLEAARTIVPHTKIYQASTSEMFGNVVDSDGYQRITTPMHPVSPYGCAKLAAHNLANNYKNAYDMFVVSGVLFNHESVRRGENFVTAKVVKNAVDIYKNKKTGMVTLGNLDSYRDWGHAKDYVKAMWMMLQNDVPTNYVTATGSTHTVRELCEYVFTKLDMDYTKHVYTDPTYMRPEELNFLRGDSEPIRKDLGWKPEYTYESMLDEMIEYFLNK